jgi:hypothetical protein
VEFLLQLNENLPAGYLVYKVEAVLGMADDEDPMEGQIHYALEVRHLLKSINLSLLFSQSTNPTKAGSRLMSVLETCTCFALLIMSSKNL